MFSINNVYVDCLRLAESISHFLDIDISSGYFYIYQKEAAIIFLAD